MSYSGFIVQLLITLAATVCVPAVGYLVIRKRTVAAHFRAGWVRPVRLKPSDLMGMRADAFHGYRPLYRYRTLDDEIRARILRGGHVLVEGAPLSGKTRALFRYGFDPFALRRAARAFGVAVRIGEEQGRPASSALAYQQLGRVLLLLAGHTGGESRTRYGQEAACALARALELFDAHRFSMNHRAAKRGLREAYDIIGSSESATEDGKRLLLGHLAGMDGARYPEKTADPPTWPHTNAGGDARRGNAPGPLDSTDIFKTGCDVRAVVRRSMPGG